MSRRLHLKNMRQRTAGRDPSEPSPDPAAQVDRIDVLIRTARTSWFGLLSYLAFVGVTLLGVDDADFFISERQTDLPLIGVSIPTLLFFWVAPTLGAALYANFHWHLTKLHEALGRADRTDVPLADRTQPWLVADLALSLRPGEVPTRPMRWMALATAFLLAYLAGPLVLAGFWFRSMPYHGELLTILGCGIPLFVSLYTIGQSVSYLTAQMRPDRQRRPMGRKLHATMVCILVLTISALGWLATEGSWEGSMTEPREFGNITEPREFGNIDDEKLDLFSGLETIEIPVATLFPDGESLFGEFLLLFRADLADVDFVNIPPDWREHDTARAAFRVEWCDDQGVPPQACGSADPWRQAQDEEAAFLVNARTDWCAEMLPEEQTNVQERCDNRFSELEARFRDAWTAEWQVQLDLLTRRNLGRADLRGANLRGARLQGADLGGARLQGADLVRARLQGAYLGGAQLQGADLVRAQLQGANLRGARLQGAYLGGAQLQGAVLDGAQLQGASLGGARLQGAYLGGAQLQGASLGGARLQGANLWRAQLQGANLWEAQLQGANLVGAQLQGANLVGAQLQGANLVGAQLQGANLRGAEMSEDTDLTDATLRGAAVRSVDDTTLARLRAHGDWPEIFHADDDIDFATFRTQWRAFAATLDPPVTIQPDYNP